MSKSEDFSIYEKLAAVDIKGMTSMKGKFNYLPWATAVREVQKLYPTFKWDFKSFDGLPYLKTEVGYFVECTVTIDDVTRTQMMPVLNFKNQADMSPTCMSINKSQQRALAKAIALHGLGLELWAGEDLEDLPANSSVNMDLISDEDVKQLTPLIVRQEGENLMWTPKGSNLSIQFQFKSVADIKKKDLEKIRRSLGIK